MLDEKYVEHQIKIDGRTIERQRYLVALRYQPRTRSAAELDNPPLMTIGKTP
jgi:hypothetical protein